MIFDFNGTIIDDVMLGVYCINELCARYLDRKPLDKEEYTHVFTFPVKHYYERVGFDFSVQDWDEVANAWVKMYNAHRDLYHLYSGVIERLRKNREESIENVLLSATEQGMLEDQLAELGIREYFDTVLGTSDIYARSKVPVIQNFMKGRDPKECLLVGDTLHDLDVAKSVEVPCILIANGHQARDVLEKEWKDVIGDIRELTI